MRLIRDMHPVRTVMDYAFEKIEVFQRMRLSRQNISNLRQAKENTMVNINMAFVCSLGSDVALAEGGNNSCFVCWLIRHRQKHRSIVQLQLQNIWSCAEICQDHQSLSNRQQVNATFMVRSTMRSADLNDLVCRLIMLRQ
jgi:hypothetical protein